MNKALIFLLLALITGAACTVLTTYLFKPYLDSEPDKFPQFGLDLPFDQAEGSKVFTNRLREKYSNSTPIESFENDLVRQGFLIKDKEANYSAFLMPCKYFWTVTWNRQGNFATNIEGTYGHGCL